jgi:hypothetical protein
MYFKRIKSLKKVKSFSAYELPEFEFPRLTDTFVGHYLSEFSRPSSLYTVTEGASSSESFGHEEDEAKTIGRSIVNQKDLEFNAPILQRALSTKSIKDSKLVNTPSGILTLLSLN